MSELSTTGDACRAADKNRCLAVLPEVVREASPYLWARNLLILDGIGWIRGSTAKLTNELFFDENYFYVVVRGLALLARPEEHTRTKIFKIFGLPI